MGINNQNPATWKSDGLASVDQYNNWYIEAAPKTYRNVREKIEEKVEQFFSLTHNLCNITPDILEKYPEILSLLRMCTCPPIAQDRLVGLASINKNFLKSMEDKKRIPPKSSKDEIKSSLLSISSILNKLLDIDIFPWIKKHETPCEIDMVRAVSIVSDRICGSLSDPIIRNAQEERQLTAIGDFLNSKGYEICKSGTKWSDMSPGTYLKHANIPGRQPDGKLVNVSIDIIIKPYSHFKENLPILIEAKSAGDATNTNKRRKEESLKYQQLQAEHGGAVPYILFLCGYFLPDYLGYIAAEGIDWIWEHRITDLEKLGI